MEEPKRHLDLMIWGLAETKGYCDCREDIPTEDLTIEWDDGFTKYRAKAEECEHCDGIRSDYGITDEVSHRDLIFK